jgi:hypothetical protein
VWEGEQSVAVVGKAVAVVAGWQYGLTDRQLMRRTALPEGVGAWGGSAQSPGSVPGTEYGEPGKLAHGLKDSGAP